MFGRQKNSEKRVRVGEHKKVLIAFCVIFSIYTLALFFVFGWIFLNSFKTKQEYWGSIYAFPKSFSLKNYVAVWNYQEEGGGDLSFVSMFQNSLILCLVLPTVNCFVTSITAYTLAKFNFKGKSWIYFVHILPMMFTLSGTQASTYILLDKMQLVDSIAGLAVMNTGVSGMNFLLVYGTYKNISNTYMEAAEIDGAGDFRIYFQIILPQAMGIIGTLWMFGFISTWNDYATVNLFLYSRPTIAVGLEWLRTEFMQDKQGGGGANYPMYYAALVISLLPIIILFMLFQEQIMKLSLGGGIKG